MDCPVCGEYGFAYASKPMGSIKFRYRQCGSCDHKFKTFEEVDAGAQMRPYRKFEVVPLKDPANVCCPNCDGETRHLSRRATAKKVVHSFQCKGCARKFVIETDLTDPIGKARSEAAERARILCPKCDGRARYLEKRRTKAGITRRYRCRDCTHCFKHATNPDGKALTMPTQIRQRAPERGTVST